MNQNILMRLEKQAEKLVLDIPASLDCDEYTPLFNEKFAELIVRECAEVCASIAAVRAGYNDADGRDTADSCGDQIKEHFGVE